ncbi:ATP12 family chaperone protein [Aestuariicoccus sp. MJ-SS9]|uniref:ATP12 family chaperone protein n=1 Tax=Aestuariicoccus sp. MJ-SS9 TaxID=3079855 RepID=UPI0029141EBD|nr:ATP12 family protein [Aestuariicoccus sp. MJ-SS9]MDU8912225.1 ATP12 family protein [Aestuariicoccus sp. MJ-SS9]
MSGGWTAKRFWKTAEVAPAEGGWTVTLDTRPVRTPAKSALVVPTRALAQAVAAEWAAQDKVIDPLSMPYTRSANAAIDKVAVQQPEVADMLAAYGDSDLLCYRADSPEELVSRQAAAWDPLLDWAAQDLGARLEPRTGIMHTPQDPDALARLSGQVHALTAFELAGFHDLVAISGSLILGFAVARKRLSAEAAWDISRIDEHWQEEQWGEDDEAKTMAAHKREAFEHADRFFALSRSAQ